MFKPAARLGFATAALIVSMVCPAAADQRQPPTPKENDEIRVTFVNIGAGLCTVIECPGDPKSEDIKTAPILYDCGSSGRGDTGLERKDAVNYVGTILERYKALPRVVVSHSDGDHYNYIEEIMRAKKAGLIWLGARRTNYSSLFQKWLKDQVQKIIKDNFEEGSSQGESAVKDLACGAEGETFLLTVNAGADSNSKSLVLQTTYKEFSATLTGDATAQSLASLLANYHDLRIDTTVLSAPHHGAVSDGSNSFVWPRAFQPKIVVYSAGTRYDHPRCAAVLDVYDTAFSREPEKALREARKHPLQCGQEGVYWEIPDYAKAQYLTATNGSIWITSDGTDNPTVECDITKEKDMTGEGCHLE